MKYLKHQLTFQLSHLLSYRGPGGGRPWPNPTNANSVSIHLFYIFIINSV